jgi:hypothetical protein
VAKNSADIGKSSGCKPDTRMRFDLPSYGRIRLFEHDAGKTAGDIAGLHQNTLYNLHFRLDHLSSGVDAVNLKPALG